MGLGESAYKYTRADAPKLEDKRPRREAILQVATTPQGEMRGCRARRVYNNDWGESENRVTGRRKCDGWVEDRETGARAHAVAAFLAFFSAFSRFFSSLESSAP